MLVLVGAEGPKGGSATAGYGISEDESKYTMAAVPHLSAEANDWVRESSTPAKSVSVVDAA